MRTAWIYLKRTLLFIFAFLLLYVAFSFLLSYIPTGKAAAADGGKKVYFFSNGVHLDFVFPLELIPDDLKDQFTYSSSARLLAVGWGDKGFYLDTETWAELKASVAIKAMFLPSPTAMHITEHSRISSQWSYATFSDQQLEEIWIYIRATFDTNTEGKIIELVGEGYGDLDRFYEAKGNYSCFKTCNTWVNTGLKRVGIRTAVWTPLDTGVLRYMPLVSGE